MTKDQGIVSAFMFSVLTFFSPAFGFFLLITCAAMVDHIFGVWRALKLNERFGFWAGMGKTTSKILAYTVIIVGAYVFDRNLINEFSVKLLSVSDITTKIVTLGLCRYEWQSINRNFKEVKGVSIWDNIGKSIQSIRRLMEKLAEIKRSLLH